MKLIKLIVFMVLLNLNSVCNGMSEVISYPERNKIYTLENDMLRVINVALDAFKRKGYRHLNYRLEVYLVEDNYSVSFIDLFAEQNEKDALSDLPKGVDPMLVKNRHQNVKYIVTIDKDYNLLEVRGVR
jgi:hypothetical protein